MGKHFLLLAILLCLQAANLLFAQASRNGVPIAKNYPHTIIDLKSKVYFIHMFSDGFADQFGGPAVKKYMSENFKKHILEWQSVLFKDQSAAMEVALSDWMGHLSQIDDVLVMGLRINKN